MPTEILYSVIGALVVTIVGLVGYIWQANARRGEQVEQRFRDLIDKLFAKLDEITETSRVTETDLRKEIAGIDRRVLRVEANCPVCRQMEQMQ